ncbi:stage II sporulation protein P [Mesobacillus harenae]|uniref:stage II sporulation protein P n=1 Tax=Mesobacillus harenae TaxID=2213203 RepID=UPI00158081A2|nr:stage II sporulation protein P [Mesobacillus harenae]
MRVFSIRKIIKSIGKVTAVFTALGLSIVLLFGTAGAVSSERFESLKLNVNVGENGTDMLLRFMSFENSLLALKVYEHQPNFSIAEMGLKLVTNIQLDDIRSLVRNELPGFALFDSDFIIAGDGVTYADIPFESAPPLDELLTEREMAAGELAELNKGLDSKTPPSGNLSEKKIFIYHTHSWETYLPLIGLEGESNEEKAVDGKTNITVVGDLLGKELENKGIGVSIDKTNVGQELQKKGWKTVKSYLFSRGLVETAMAGNEQLDYFIDLHRDSARKKSTSATINNEPYAKLVFVIGKDNKNYQKNLQFANELHKFLEGKYPGLSKGILQKSGTGVDGVYNQDLSPNSLVVEVGGVDNNMKEIKNTVSALADAISQHYWKAAEVNAQGQ